MKTYKARSAPVSPPKSNILHILERSHTLDHAAAPRGLKPRSVWFGNLHKQLHASSTRWPFALASVLAHQAKTASNSTPSDLPLIHVTTLAVQHPSCRWVGLRQQFASSVATSRAKLLQPSHPGAGRPGEGRRNEACLLAFRRRQCPLRSTAPAAAPAAPEAAKPAAAPAATGVPRAANHVRRRDSFSRLPVFGGLRPA